MKNLKSSANIDRRRETRRSYSGYIFFATPNHVYEGMLRNFSRTGLFIETSNSLKVGDRITIALPHFDDKRAGKIVWANRAGFGVRLGSLTSSSSQPQTLYKRISSQVIRLFRDNV